MFLLSVKLTLVICCKNLVEFFASGPACQQNVSSFKPQDLAGVPFKIVCNTVLSDLRHLLREEG